MKKLLMLLLCLILAMSVALTSCDASDDGKKDDESSENGPGNTPGNKPGNEKVDCEKGKHKGDVICEACSTPLFTVAELKELPDLSSFGIKLTDFEVAVDEGHYDNDGTVTLDVAELYIALGENGLEGYGEATLNMAYANFDRKTSVDVALYVADNAIYAYIDGVGPGNYDDLPINGAYIVEVEKIAEIVEAKAYLEESALIAEQYLPIIEELYTNTIAPIFENVNLDGVGKVCGKYTAKLINAIYAVEKVGNNYKISLSLDFIKEWNQALATKSIAEVIDLALGEGTLQSVVDFVCGDKLYNFSVADAINYLETKQGIDLVDLLKAVDTVIATVTENKDATLENTLLPLLFGPEAEIPEGFDLDAFLKDEKLLALSVKDALIYGADFPADDPSTKDVNEFEEALKMLKEELVAGVAMLKQFSFYDLMLSMGGEEAPMPEPDYGYEENEKYPDNNYDDEGTAKPLPMAKDFVEEFERPDYTEYINQVNAMVDMVSDLFSLTYTANSNKVITKVDFALNYADGPGELSLTASATQGSATLNFKLKVEREADIDLTVTASTKKVALEIDATVEDTVISGTYELIFGHKMTPDADTVAAIKAMLAKADGVITKENLYDALNYKYEKYVEYEDFEKVDGAFKIFDDTANERYVVVRLDYDEVQNNDGNGAVSVVAGFTVYFYGYTDYFAYSVVAGCGDNVAISPIYNISRGTAKVDMILPVGYDSDVLLSYIELDTLGLDDLTSEYVENKQEDAPFIYNTKTGEISFDNFYDNGHNWVKNEDKSDDEGNACNVIYKTHFDCANCDAEYDRYQAGYNHNFELDEEASPRPTECGEYWTLYETCADCGRTRPSNSIWIEHIDLDTNVIKNGEDYQLITVCKACDDESSHTLDVDVPFEVSDLPLKEGDNHIALTLTVEAAGDYYFEIDSQGYVTYNLVNENGEYFASGEYTSYDYRYVYLEAGEYTFTIEFIEGWDYTCYLVINSESGEK